MANHIGQKIKVVLEKSGISKSELARKLNMSSTNVHKIFKRETIDTGLLQKISQVLKFDFFQYYKNPSITTVQEEKATYHAAKSMQAMESDLEKLRKEVERLKLEQAEKEIAYLKRINELLLKKK